jgi:hypothetical protein
MVHTGVVVLLGGEKTGFVIVLGLGRRSWFNEATGHFSHREKG